MMDRTINIILLSIALAAAGFVGAGFGGGSPQAQAQKIAYVDVSRVLSTHRGLAAEQEELELSARDSQTILDGRREELEKLRAELMVYSRGSKEYVAKEFEIERKKLEFELQGRQMQYELDQRKADALLKACTEIEKALIRYSKEFGIDVILSAPFSVSKVRTNDPNDILKWLSDVDVVWADDALDITEVVITIVNGS